MLLLAVFVLLQIINFTPTEGENIVWTDIPASASGIEGQSVNITWITDLREFASGTTWSYVDVYNQPGGSGSKDRMIKLTAPSTKYVFSNYRSRAADLTLTVSKTGTVVTIVFKIDNLNKTTDAKEYRFRLETTAFGEDSLTGTLLNVLVPIVITSPNPHYITVNESDAAQLVCAATGNPEPKINWTRHGVLVGTGMYTTDIVGINDDKTCNYTCIAYNGLHGAKTANVCLNVQFKPRGAVVVSDKTTVCQNDNVTLTCTSGPANPAPSSYEFYNNGVLVGTSATNVYVAIATAGLPSVNKFSCVPRNLLGGSLENGSVEVIAKVKPVIVTPPKPTTVVVEGNVLTLFCNASGLPTPKIMWINAVGSTVSSGETLTISNIARGNEGTYRCTASNGDECNTASPNVAVTVNYKPENTSLTTNKSDNTFLKGETVRLSCTSSSKPPSCNVTFYHGSTAIGRYSYKTCSGGEVANHVIESIGGCNEETYSCKVENEYGYEESKINLTIKVPATINRAPANDLIVVEGETLQLNCTATGCPTPNITWTKTGVSASLVSGNSFFLSHQINSLSKGDTGDYVCTVNNGVVGSPVSKIIHVNVTYKHYQTTLTSTLTKACLNDSVTLTCTTNANPPAHEYRFYLNGQLVHTSSSGVYQLNVPQAGNNTYKCAPKNTIGFGVNASVTVFTKAPPKITFFSSSKSFVEGASVVLMCNVTGSDPMNVTWSKVGGTSYPKGYSLTFPTIVREDESTYQCTAHNGNECFLATAQSLITVMYKPENTSLTTNKSDNTFLKGETVRLSCTSSSKPPSCNVTFYHGSTPIGHYSSKTCSGGEVASHMIESIGGCNEEMYSCKVENEYGYEESKINLTIKVFKEKRMGQFEIMNLKWQDELKDSKSTAYRNLKNQCMKILKAAYENIAYVVEMNVNAFVKGSVIVLFQLDIIDRVPDPLLPLKTLIKDNGGEINGLTIALESVQESKDFKEEPIPNNNNNKTVIAVLGALFAVSLVLNIILIIFVIWLRRKESIDKLIKRSVNNDEIGNMNDITLQETSFISTNNITGNSVQEYEPVDSLGLVPSSAEIPGYEAVSIVTQPTQQQSGVQSTTNSTTKNEVVDRQREKNCEGNKPDRTGQSQGHKEQLPTNAPSLYQTIQSQSSTYSSLSPITKLPAKNTKSSTPKINGEYQTIQKKEVPPQYQSLDDLGRC